MTIAENILVINEKIHQLSPHPEKVSIVGVAKYQPPEKIQEGIEAGLGIIANNYIQSGSSLMKQFSRLPVQWHFIGHIQTNKAKNLTPYHCVQSIDRMEVATTLNRRLENTGKKIEVLVEINIGEEPQKSGISMDELSPFLEQLDALPFLELRGLMCLPPPLYPLENRRPYFAKMKEFQTKYRSLYPLPILSMGTSEDYSIALEEGATMVRLGTSLFGERDKRNA